MPLTKTLEEVKAVLPRLVSTSSTWTNLPDWAAVEEKHIIPIIGRELYEALVADYDAGLLTAEEITLVSHIRRASVPYGFYDDIGLYVLQLQDSGAKKVSQGGQEPVRGWEIQELKNTLIRKATEGMEVLIRYLFDKKDLYPEWTGSQEYLKINSLLIRTGLELKEQYSVYQPQRTFFLLRSLMADIQRMAIQEDIGKELLTYLRDTGDLPADLAEPLGYLRKAVAFLTIWKACSHFSVQFSDHGFTILGERNNNVMENQMNQALDLQLLNQKMESCRQEGNAYLDLARAKLVECYHKQNAAEAFKTALDAGPLKNYLAPADRTSGNEKRKIFVI